MPLMTSTSKSSSDDESSTSDESLVHGSKTSPTEPTLRLHHLDWLRSIMVGFAVFCHVTQTLEAPLEPKVADTQFWTAEAGHFEEFWHLRIITVGRQFCIPLLFYISGASFALGKGFLGPFFLKLGAITLIGMALNWGLFSLGPQDPDCDFNSREQPKCQKGIVLDFLLAPHAGTIFPVVYQFWFTIALMFFMVEDFMLYAQLRIAYAGHRLQVHYLVLRFVLVSGIYVAMTFEALQWPQKLELVVCEALVMVCLVLSMKAASNATPEVPSIEGRVWQHLAMGICVVQFALPDFSISGFNGNLFVYGQFFRQFMAVGFATTLSRKTVPAVVTRVWPLTMGCMIMTTAPSSFFLGGIISYPWLPNVVDRIAYMSGTALIVGTLDRLGKIIGEAGLLFELPSFISNGTLVWYLVHPLLIAVMAKLPGMTAVSFSMLQCGLLVGSLAIASWLKEGNYQPRFSGTLAVGVTGFMASVVLMAFNVKSGLPAVFTLCGMCLFWAAARSTSEVNGTEVR